MKSKKGMLGWPKGLKIAAKLFAMVAGYALLCCIPLFMKESILNAFRDTAASAPTSIRYAGDSFFNSLFLWFAVILGAMLLINVVFFIIDESLNDTVRYRRVMQIMLNVLVIVFGVACMLYLSLMDFPSNGDWSYILFSAAATFALSWGPAAIFLFCGVAEFIWDVWFFCGSNRAPWSHRILMSKAMK